MRKLTRSEKQKKKSIKTRRSFYYKNDYMIDLKNHTFSWESYFLSGNPSHLGIFINTDASEKYLQNLSYNRILYER